MMRTLVAAFLAIASQATAQGARSPALGTLEGVVVDSVRGGALRGAAVKVEGTSRFAFTDSLGRYRVDSVPAGSYAVELFHEILDTLGVRVYAPPLEFVPGVTVTLDLGIPSPRTIIRSKCQASAADAGAVFGVVLDADREEPLAGVEVSVAWTELRISREGFSSDAHRRGATTDAEGRFKLCYLPTDLSADILAVRGTDSTSAVHVAYDQAAFGTATIFLDASPAGVAAEAPVPAARRGASLRGTVVDSTGKPVVGARAGFAWSPNAAVTDSAGRFSMDGQRPGTQALIVRRLGYAPAEVIVNLTRRAPREVTVQLAPFVPVLAAVLVKARHEVALERVGFTNRRRVGVGRFLTQEQLERRNAFRIDDYLTMLPSLYRGGTSSGENCTVFWVDGVKWTSHPDEFMSPGEVAAIEAYSASMAPIEFQGLDGCAVVLIWTKLKLGIR
ncbi:MAG TPA: carboxypeptidase regulatory-like domain-containing protein [Gemmatimonadaceae bacterium]|nr:carboxypeptidase regulatory-like domain-containing protein [Gemmatimonadaceae bacterium]